MAGGGAAPRRPLQAAETGGGEILMGEGALLELREVHKSFGAVHALNGVDFHVAKGEVMALVGDNGAGKSTLVKCIAGIYQIDDGQMLWDGQEVSVSSPKDASAL